MNLLELDIHEYIPDITEAYVEVFGEKHRDVIEKRLNNIIYFPYNKPENMQGYLNRLKEFKRRNLGIKFLEKIGVDVSEEKNKKYTDPLNDDLSSLLMDYLGIDNFEHNNEGIKSFNGDSKKSLFYEIKFLNFFNDDKSFTITKDNFEEFCKTDKYKEIHSKVDEYLKIYEPLEKEYDDYLKELSPYQEYVDTENARKEQLEKKYLSSMYEKTVEEGLIPDETKAALDKLYSDDTTKANVMFGTLGTESNLECFSREVDKKLLNDEILLDYFTYNDRLNYLKGIGVIDQNFELGNDNYKETYEGIVAREDIKKYIPTYETVENISKLKHEFFEKAEEDFNINSPNIIKNAENIRNNATKYPDTTIYFKNIKNNKTCVTNNGYTDYRFTPVLYLTVTSPYASGGLDYLYLHEFCHVCGAEGADSSDLDDRSGFEPSMPLGDTTDVSPYNNQYRKYERLNENFTDILCIEAMNIMHNKGIYFMEPEEICDLDVSNHNTFSITKDMLSPFLSTYRDCIMDAIIDGNYEELFNVIGKENFEELNDVINKTDFLNMNGQLTAEEYSNQNKRLENIYANMKNYKSKDSISNTLLASAISATEESTRTGQINSNIDTLVELQRQQKSQQLDLEKS